MGDLTREEILAMEPGRELDALIAEYVFGWRKIPGPKTDYDGPCELFNVLVPPTIDNPFPLYPPRGAIKLWYFCHNWSTELSAAMELFTYFGWQGTVGYSGTDWFCNIMNGFDDNGSAIYGEVGDCDAAPEAISKAALMAKLPCISI